MNQKHQTYFLFIIFFLLISVTTDQAEATGSVTIRAFILPQCSDLIDNDSDVLVDYPLDPGCASETDEREEEGLPVCADGEDNDLDGRIDYPRDSGCSDEVDEDESDPPPPANVPASTTDSTGGTGGGGNSIPSSILRVVKQFFFDFLPEQEAGQKEDRATPSLSPTPDLNRDGAVDIIDFSVILYAYDKSIAADPHFVKYDLNEDGLIDIYDISIILFHW